MGNGLYEVLHLELLPMRYGGIGGVCPIPHPRRGSMENEACDLGVSIKPCDTDTIVVRRVVPDACSQLNSSLFWPCFFEFRYLDPRADGQRSVTGTAQHVDSGAAYSAIGCASKPERISFSGRSVLSRPSQPGM